MSTATVTDWYAVLGVGPDAEQDEIRSAWRAAVADLDPTSATFAVLNEAGRTLLDPERRAAYDASRVVEPEPEERPDEAESLARAAEEAAEPRSARALRTVPGWAIVVAAVLAAAAVAWVAWLLSTPSDADIEDATREAQTAAERAVVPVLSYDAADMDASADAAHEWLTADYREDYDKLFAVLEENAASTGTKVEVDLLASSIVRSGEDRADILLFVNRPTTNKQGTQPVVYRDQVTLSMERVDGRWLVDQLATSPVQS